MFLTIVKLTLGQVTQSKTVYFFRVINSVVKDPWKIKDNSTAFEQSNRVVFAVAQGGWRVGWGGSVPLDGDE